MTFLVAAAFLVSMAFAAETKVTLESLPPGVQAAIKAQTQGATITGITSEKEKGKMTYEVETKVNGKGRDLTFDQAGKVIETEEEIEMDSVPAAAKAAIQKHAAAGAISKVEKVTAGSSVGYEATIKGKNGKESEYAVNADGSPRKED